MNKTVLLSITIGLLLLINSCNEKGNKKYTLDYQPQYTEVWPKLNTFIETMWDSATVTNPSLPKEFITVDYGRTIMFYWDSYFTNVGLLKTPDKIHLARNACDNLLFQG